MQADNESSQVHVPVRFLRARNALVAEVEMGPIYMDYCLHLADHALRFSDDVDRLLRELLAAAVLHGVSRPRTEVSAWTVHLREPLANLFVSVDSRLGTVVGTAFEENIREDMGNLFYADVVKDGQPLRRSVVEISSGNMLTAVEHFYRQSEQRSVRLFEGEEEKFTMVSAMPDCDEEWLESLTAENYVEMLAKEESSLLETRVSMWKCGCSQKRMLSVLEAAMHGDPENLFQGEESVRIRCPRCGARYVITREAMEAHVASQEKKVSG